MTWKNWGDHPVVVIIGVISAICGTSAIVLDHIDRQDSKTPEGSKTPEVIVTPNLNKDISTPENRKVDTPQTIFPSTTSITSEPEASPTTLRQDTVSRQPSIEGVWKGEWSNPKGHLYAFEMKATVSSNGNVSGQFIWTLMKSPDSQEQQKIGLQGTEYVEGTYNPSQRLANIEGQSKNDPQNVIGLDKYRIFVSEDGQSITGDTANHGNWQGRLSGSKVE